jgi:hypothetical protein
MRTRDVASKWHDDLLDGALIAMLGLAARFKLAR